MKYKSINFIIIFFLIVPTILIYSQVRHHDFIDYDDNLYVTQNVHVQQGLSREGIGWALSYETASFCWQPLTWLSHMLDCELFGLNPGMHHLVNLIFHIINTVLLFIVLRNITGALWQSAFVAFLFALHPINVDTVAWIAERKNVLYAFFWILTIQAYSYYAKRPRFSAYLLMLLLFVSGLLSKPAMVTLPFVLLLIDYWPLGRISIGKVDTPPDETAVSQYKRTPLSLLILEKLPLLAIIIAYIVILMPAVIPRMIETAPMDLRIANALVSYIKYIGKAFWPVNLAIYYPFPVGGIPSWQVFTAVFFLLFISIAVLVRVKSRPYLAVGWFWFTGNLIPVSGIIQHILWPAMADRWTYLPFIGLYIMVAWGIPDLLSKWRFRRLLMAGLSIIVISILSLLTFTQLHYWKNSMTLFQHALDVTKDNCMAHNIVAVCYGEKGELDAAYAHISEAIRICPNSPDPHVFIAKILEKNGRFDEALQHYYYIIKIQPQNVYIHIKIGSILLYMGKVGEAIAHFQKALELDPQSTDARNNLGVAFAKQGKYAEAIQEFKEALRIDPHHKLAQDNLNRLLNFQSSDLFKGTKKQDIPSTPLK